MSFFAARSAFSRDGQLLGGRDDDDVVLLALVEALGAQHDVERLVPRHVLQAQRHVAA